MQHKLRDACNRWCDHHTLHRHRFHERDWNSLAVAGQDHDIGARVEIRKVGSRDVSGKRDLFLQLQHGDQSLKGGSLRAITRDRAANVHTC